MTQLWNAHQEALTESGVQPPFRLYDLRHTYGTRAVEAGMDVLTLMRLMGHASLHTTNRYVHLTHQHLERAQKRLTALRTSWKRPRQPLGGKAYCPLSRNSHVGKFVTCTC